MSDKELLELAARVAGYARLKYLDDVPYVSSLLSGEDFEAWNPLDDDGDALRLAVKLGIFDLLLALGELAFSDGFDLPGDKYAKVRRAIVRAAAIGKSSAPYTPTASSDLPEDNYYETHPEAEADYRPATSSEIGKTMSAKPE